MSESNITRKLNPKEKLTIQLAKSYYGGKSPIQLIYIPKADKEFIIAFKSDPNLDRTCEISILDGPEHIGNPASFIRYELRDYGMHIGYFKTQYEYQGLGIGKFIYQLAQAHADKLGLKFSNGLICPIGDIKGITSSEPGNLQREYKFLTLMYHALGNNIVEKKTFQGINLEFEDNWKRGQKLAKLSENQKEYLDKIVTFELAKNEKYIEKMNKGKGR